MPALGLQGASALAEPITKLPDVPRRQEYPLANAAATADTTGFTNRIREIAIHVPWYGFKTQARLARDSGVSPATISRLVHRKSQPSLKLSLQIAQALSYRLGRPLDVREVFSVDGRYPTPSVCILTGCRSCLPPEAYDEDENLKPEYCAMKAGAWSLETGVEGLV